MSITSKANNPFPQVEEKQGAELLSEYLNSHQEVLDIIESRVKVEIEQSILEIHFNLIQYNCIDKLVTFPEVVFTTDNSNPFYYGYKENKIYINTKYLIFNFISRHKITKKEFLQNKDDIIKSVEFIGAHIAKHEYGHHLQWSMFSKETMGRYLDKKDLGFRQRVETQAIMFSALFFIVEKHNRK
jgi:ABC-type antimicrobial peptide transport system permease subunit